MSELIRAESAVSLVVLTYIFKRLTWNVTSTARITVRFPSSPNAGVLFVRDQVDVAQPLWNANAQVQA